MSGIQFNLLPDVKLEYIKAQRSKKLIMTISVIVAGAALAVFLVVFVTVEGVQKKQLNNANSAISSAQNKLQTTPGLGDIVTVQNQLQALTSLQHDKHINSRIFSFLPDLTPTNVGLASLSLDMTTNEMDISGSAASQAAINTFIDTLKFTTYKVGSQDSDHKAFLSVVENSFSPSDDGDDYTLDITFDPQLFSNDLSTAPTLTVPKLTTTVSALADPNSALFNSGGH